MIHARGTFEISATSEPPFDEVDGVTLSRTLFSKRFTGDLAGTSEVFMTAVRTEVPGSAAYVALERVRGTLAGRSGSFVLTHLGVMGRGTQSLQITVVGDSATGELRGLRGTMQIEIVDGQHRYTGAFELPSSEAQP